MTKEEKFDVSVSALEAMLTKRGIYLDYFSAWKISHGCDYGKTIRESWVYWLRHREPKFWISSAFKWSVYNIPGFVWKNTNDDWQEWISANINN